MLPAAVCCAAPAPDEPPDAPAAAAAVELFPCATAPLSPGWPTLTSTLTFFGLSWEEFAFAFALAAWSEFPLFVPLFWFGSTPSPTLLAWLLPFPWPLVVFGSLPLPSPLPFPLLGKEGAGSGVGVGGAAFAVGVPVPEPFPLPLALPALSGEASGVTAGLSTTGVLCVVDVFVPVVDASEPLLLPVVAVCGSFAPAGAASSPLLPRATPGATRQTRIASAQSAQVRKVWRLCGGNVPAGTAVRLFPRVTNCRNAPRCSPLPLSPRGPRMPKLGITDSTTRSCPVQ